MDRNKKNATNLKTMMNYPRPGRKARFNPGGTIASEVDKNGNTVPAIKDMTPKECKDYGKQPARKD